MTTYSIALFFHLLSLLLAVACTALSSYAALQLRAAHTADKAKQALALSAGIEPLFPAAGIGLLITGAYMAHSIPSWSEPWVLASLIGLACIVVLGAGIDGQRKRALGRELHRHGFSDRARALMRDPVAWTAKLTGPTLLLAVIFIMTTKPTATACAGILILAGVAGTLGALPFWQAPAVGNATRAEAN